VVAGGDVWTGVLSRFWDFVAVGGIAAEGEPRSPDGPSAVGSGSVSEMLVGEGEVVEEAMLVYGEACFRT
jgi:hypothetical protein